MSASTANATGKTEEGKKKKNPIVLILIVLIVLLLAGGGAAFFYFKNASSHPGPVKLPPPVFFSLDPFTVNMSSDDGDIHYLHLGLTLRVPSAETTEKLRTYLPEIRSRILLLLSSKKPEDLATVEGKTKLTTDIAHTIEQSMPKDGSDVKVNGVLLTDFVIQ